MTPIRLRDLGPVSVSMDGAGSGTVLTQPRLLALLAYLVVARPRGRHSRDTLIDLLWPEADQNSGRQALRNALHRLRSSLGEGVIESVGESFVTIAPGAITSDSLELEAAVSAGRWDEAIVAYHGPFLNGFHVDGAPDFEQWLDGERARLASLAVTAAWSEVQSRRSSDLAGAIRAAAFACTVAPDDERSFRQYLELLVDAGDHAAARRAFDAFAQRLRAEYDVEPAAETRAVLQRRRHAAPAASNARQAPPAIGVVERLDDTAAPEPPAPRGRRPLVAAGAFVLVVAVVIVLWRLSQPSAVAADVRVIGAGLHPRWRTDTALLAKYLRGSAQLAERNVVGARATFSRLTQDAPLYAPGWAGLALATMRSAFHDIPPRDAYSRGLVAVRRALEMDSSLAMAQAALVHHELFGRWDLGRARERLDAALALHPDDPALLALLGTWHLWRGEFREVLAIRQLNAGNEPLNTVFSYQVIFTLYFAHRCADAVAVYHRLPPETRQVVTDGGALAALLCAGLRDEVASLIREEAVHRRDTTIASLFVEPLPPVRRDSAIEAALRIRLDRQHARRLTSWFPPEHIMLNYALRKHVDSTLIWLDSMLVERSLMLHVVPFDPLMDFLRAERRFDSVLKRLTWLPSLGPSMHQLVDSLRLVARR